MCCLFLNLVPSLFCVVLDAWFCFPTFECKHVCQGTPLGGGIGGGGGAGKGKSLVKEARVEEVGNRRKRQSGP